MRTLVFARRCARELLRDPLTLMFGLGFPVVLLLLLSAIQANIPVPLFEIQHLTPGITVFGLSFMALFAATLVAKDRESTFLRRLYTTPMTAADFIGGYLLPLLPMALVQSVITYLVAILLGLPITIHLLYAILLMLPSAVFYVSLGLLCGSALGVKQVGGVCGALLTNLSAWMSGIWFDLDLVGDGFKRVANLLPFVHMVELERHIVGGRFTDALPHLFPILLYAVATLCGAVWLFLRQMKKA